MSQTRQHIYTKQPQRQHQSLGVPMPQTDIRNVSQPELSRAEYLHLLRTAKALDKEKAYLLVKLFVQELPEMTAEAVREGKIVCDQDKYKQVESNIFLPVEQAVERSSLRLGGTSER